VYCTDIAERLFTNEDVLLCQMQQAPTDLFIDPLAKDNFLSVVLKVSVVMVTPQ
jgi:hypothetical protein